MSFLAFILFGLIVGTLARLLVPGPQKMGWLATLALGVLGALLGGFLSQALGLASREDPISFFIAVLGAVVVLVLVQMVRGRRV